MARTGLVAEAQQAVPAIPGDPTDVDALPNAPVVQKRIRDYFRWQTLPWWICFIAGIFLLTKLQIVYNDSPCAVLGTQGPVALSDVKKAFRTLSLCTHPDRLRGRLKRQATAAEERRGEIIFNRANAAKEELTKLLKYSKQKTVACYQGELELALLAFFAHAGKAIAGLGIGDYWAYISDFGRGIVTLEAGFMNTCCTVLWLGFVWRIGRQFFGFLWGMGVIRMVVALFTTVVIGPIPTVIHFVFLPCFRLSVFLQGVWKELRPPVETQEAKQEAKPEDAADAAPQRSRTANEELPHCQRTSAMKAAAAANAELPHRGIRQRKKKESEEDKTKRGTELLTGTNVPETQTPAEVLEEAMVPGGPMPEGIWKCITWTVREPIKARQNAANAVQFDLLLLLTKPIIPLVMLISIGQVWNGLFSSLVIGHVLRKWVPQMSYEAHHLIIMFFGLVHTLLGVSSNQVEDHAAREGAKMLQLAWSWSFKDVLCIMHMCLVGSTVTAMSSLGNEPSYAASFAAGIAMRIAMAQDSVKQLSPIQFAAGHIESGLRNLGITLVASEETVAYSGHGIGDCGGGPFRMMFGDGPQAMWAARMLKVWLMIMPLMAAGQWLLRAIQAGKMLGKKRKTTRFVQRATLFIFSLVQCFLLANVELNASNGALGNFWVAMLFGCVGESLMCTFDVRGPVRQIVFLLLFLLI